MSHSVKNTKKMKKKKLCKVLVELGKAIKFTRICVVRQNERIFHTIRVNSRGCQVDSIYKDFSKDFSKVFDKVRHCLLLDKISTDVEQSHCQ
jgi:hypothetical protein